MAWSTQKWAVFRATNAFVTNGAGHLSITDDDVGFGAYPLSKTLDSDTFDIGWVVDIPQTRDRDSGADARLAGIAFTANDGNPKVFRWDVPAASTQVRIAAGDPDNDRAYLEWAVYDNASLLETIVVSANTPAGQWRDAVGSLHTSNAAWIANNAAKTYSISSGILIIKMGSAASQSDVTAFSTVGILQPSSGFIDFCPSGSDDMSDCGDM